MATFLPNNRATEQTQKFPIIVVRFPTEPIQEDSSMVNGPDRNGVLCDCNTNIAGDTHPIPQPTLRARILAERNDIVII